MNDTKDTIVCECHRVRESDIIALVRSGAQDFSAVQKITKVGTGCHKCIPRVMALIQQHKESA